VLSEARQVVPGQQSPFPFTPGSSQGPNVASHPHPPSPKSHCSVSHSVVPVVLPLEVLPEVLPVVVDPLVVEVPTVVEPLVVKVPAVVEPDVEVSDPPEVVVAAPEVAAVVPVPAVLEAAVPVDEAVPGQEHAA
jgi:hypothetical protein